MGSTTYVGRALRALQFKTDNEIWAAIGRTTAWDNEADPPDDPIDITGIEEPVCYVKCQVITLAKIVEADPDITINGEMYEYVADEDYLDDDGRFLVCVATFEPSGTQPYGNFRQLGFYANLTPTTGHEADTWLAPAHVLDEGVLIYVHNDVVTTMAESRDETIKIALEFR